VKHGAAEALVRDLARDSGNRDPPDNWSGLLTTEGSKKCFKVGAGCRRIALKSVRSDGLARPYA